MEQPQNPETGIRNPEPKTGIQKPETGIRNQRKQALQMRENCFA